MASTSQTPTSSSSSPSSTSAATSTSTANNIGGGGFGVSSAPLIFSFLAIGLLTAAAVGALGWRRVYLARFGSPLGGRGPYGVGGGGVSIAGRNANVNRSHQSHVDIGEKPKLWDLQAKVREGGERGEGVRSAMTNALGARKSPMAERAWEDIMPIAVCPLLYENHCTGQESSLSDADESGPEEMTVAKFFAFTVQLIREQLDLFIQHYRQRAGGTAVSERMQQRQDRDGEAATNAMRERGRHIVSPSGGDNLDLRRYDDLQVTVAIAMPRPKESNMKTEDRGSKVEDYSFGICQVQWKDSGQEI